MQFDQLKQRELIALRGGVAASECGASACRCASQPTIRMRRLVLLRARRGCSN
jgi:hypothetical protein